MNALEKLEAAFTLTGDALHEVAPTMTLEERDLFRKAMSSMASLGAALEEHQPRHRWFGGEEKGDG